MGKRFGLVVLVLALSATWLGFRDKAPTVSAAAPIAGPAIRPLDVVTSLVARGLESLRSQQIGASEGEERRAAIRGTAHEHFDVNDMTRRALGQHWKGLSSREQEELSRLFGDVLTQFFVTIAERYDGNVSSLDEEVVGIFARVRSRIALEEGSESAIEYRLSRSGSQWRIYDIVLDGVSLVANYRSQFHSIIGTSSVADLLERMRALRSRRTPSREAVGGATTAELETSARGRLAAGLLLSVVSYPRRR